MIYKVERISSYSDEEYRAAYESLPEDRREKADGYKNEADRKRCVFSYALLLRMLREVYGINVQEAEFYTEPNGKPHLVGDRAHFSISHSGDFVVCAVNDLPVGIDIEVGRTVSMSTIERVCNQEELSYVFDGKPKEVADEDACYRFLHIWTLKEAYLKYTGEGISGGFQTANAVIHDGVITAVSTGQKLQTKYTDEYALSVVWDGE